VSSQQNEVEQHPESLSVPEGALASFSCTYRNSSSQFFGWYRQYSDKGLELLLSAFSNGNKNEGKFSAYLNRASHFFVSVYQSLPAQLLSHLQ
jgi:T cell receptor alpha chain V region